MGKRVIKVHVDHILKNETPVTTRNNVDYDIQYDSDTEGESGTRTNVSNERRYPQRVRRPVERYGL